jgi:polygalacturonase/PKD repeat protein
LSQPVRAADPPLPVIPSRTTNVVVNFGAKGDGTTDNAGSINAAINAVSTAGGGTVEIPTNGSNVFMSGPIIMKSSVNLHLDSGVTLKMFPMSTWVSNFGSTTFINASSLTDIEISGTGTNDGTGTINTQGIIEGQGTNWWSPLASNRPNLLTIGGCTRVLIQNVKLQNPPTFTIYMKSSDTSVTIQGITINTPYDSHNTDAFDITSTNVLIRNSYISTGDDDIEIGGTGAKASDITISNCTFGTGHGVSIGSFTGGGVNNLIVSNCWWNGTEYGIKMKTDRDRGGLLENLKYCDMTMTNVNFPFAFYMYYNSMGSPSKSITNTPAGAAADTPQSITSTTPIFRNVTISNLTAVGNSGIQGPGNIAGLIFGLPESPITNVTLCKVNIQGRSSDGTVCMYNVRDIRIIDSNLTMPLVGTNVLTLYNAQVTLTNTVANPNVVTITGLGSPSNSVLSVFNGQAGTRDASVFGANPLLTLAGSTLTVSNNMSLGGSSILNFGLGTNVTKTVATGNLTLGGTLNVADGGGFNTGTYTVFTYGGALTYNGLTVGTKPNTNFTYTVSTNTAGQVNLIVSGSVSPPTASFTGSPTSGTAPLPVNFTDGSSGSITNWFWNFGDGNTTNFAVSTNPSHTYNVGTYNVSLTVSGVGGTNTLTRSNYIVATNPPPPVANFTANPISGTEPLLATFTDTSTGTAPLSLSWNLGDSTTTNTAGGANFTHTYAAGSYTVTLTASNFVGASTLVSNNLINVLTALQSWQIQYFGSTSNPAADPNADPDGDGMSNMEEFLAGTDPTNSTSALRIASVVQTINDVVVTWTYGPGKTNALQETAGADDGSYQTNNFADIFTVTNTVGTITNYLDVGAATNTPSRFYRVRLVP